MPNAAPPRTRHPRSRTSQARDTSSPTAATVPALWTGLGDLVASMVERNPAEALTIANVAEAQTGPVASVALKSLWDTPVAAARAHSRFVVRTLDAGGRLSLPLACDDVANLAVQRRQEVLTVYLPGAGSDAGTRISATVSLRGGRLALGKALRDQLGIADRADVLVLHDGTANTLTLTAASRLDQLVADTLTCLGATAQRSPDIEQRCPDTEHSAASTTHLRLVHNDTPTNEYEEDLS